MVLKRKRKISIGYNFIYSPVLSSLVISESIEIFKSFNKMNQDWCRVSKLFAGEFVIKCCTVACYRHSVRALNVKQHNTRYRHSVRALNVKQHNTRYRHSVRALNVKQHNTRYRHSVRALNVKQHNTRYRHSVRALNVKQHNTRYRHSVRALNVKQHNTRPKLALKARMWYCHMLHQPLPREL